jgi:hypothetical protein
MDEISNRTLAMLLIGAIVISLGGTLISLNKLGKMKAITITGLAPGTVNQTSGNVSLEIRDITWINFSVRRCNFGSGYVVKNTCDLNSSGWENSTDPGGCSPEWDTTSTCTSPLEIKNIGNNNVTLNITWANSSKFMQSSGGKLYFKMLNGTGAGLYGGCTTSGGSLAKFYNSWREVTAEHQHNVTCDRFYYGQNRNVMSMHIKVSFTQLATKGYKSNLITAVGKSLG